MPDSDWALMTLVVTNEREMCQQYKHDAPASKQPTELTCDSASDKASLYVTKEWIYHQSVTCALRYSAVRQALNAAAFLTKRSEQVQCETVLRQATAVNDERKCAVKGQILRIAFCKLQVKPYVASGEARVQCSAWCFPLIA